MSSRLSTRKWYRMPQRIHWICDRVKLRLFTGRGGLTHFRLGMKYEMSIREASLGSNARYKLMFGTNMNC